MAPERFVACLTMLGWSHRHIVGLLRCDTNLATRWSRGQAPVPPSIEVWLEALVRCAVRHLPPEDWRVREPPPTQNARSAASGVDSG